jgi:PRC-barrel domain
VQRVKGVRIVVVMFDDETTVAWRAMPYRAPVVAADGSEIGTAESLLGDEEEDIFHGIVIKPRHSGKPLEIPAVRIKKITTKHVVTDLSDDEVQALPAYREEHWFHIGWGGLFRKHPEWDETSRT